MTFETIYREQYAALYRFCYRMNGSAEEARDLTQETFMRFYTAVQHQQTPDQPVAWLYRVAGNLCCSAARQNRRRAQLLDQNHELLQSRTEDGADPERMEVVLRIREVLERLSPREQLLIHLYQEHHSYAEIAEIVGVSKSSVGTLLSRALARLRAPIVKGNRT